MSLVMRTLSNSEPGRVQIAPATYALIGDKFLCDPHGPVEIKGVEEVPTWFLMGRIV